MQNDEFRVLVMHEAFYMIYILDFYEFTSINIEMHKNSN